MKNGILILAGALLLAPTTPLAAQTIGSYPAAERGQHSISLSIDGDSQIGYWTRQSDRTDLGLELGVTGLFSDSNSSVSLNLTPAIKHYVTPAGPLAPYTYLGIPVSFARASNDLDSQHSFGLGGVFAFGVDWFPLPQVSVGGHAGVDVFYSNVGSGSGLFSVRTFTSAIRAQLYF
jgi:hypothetical protein